jgi:hypothetical protein
LSDIFERNDSDAPAIDPDKDYFTELVGDDKQYKDTKAAGRALVEKENYIKQLEKEGAEARQELQARLTVEEALTKMQTSASTTANERSSDNSGQGNSSQSSGGNGAENKSAKELSEADISNLVKEGMLAQKKEEANQSAEALQAANLTKVKTKLEAEYGSGYASKVQEKATELGVSTQFLSEMGAREPNALFKLLDVGDAPKNIFNADPPRGRVNTSSMTVPNSGVRNEEYYQKVRKTNPKEFYSQAVQTQRHKDALRLGQAFFD